jgi:hypothetical protein
MTDSPQPSRPQQVTTAVVLSVAACVLAVVNLFGTRDDLRGTSLRDTIAEAQDGAGALAQDEQLVVRVLEVLVFVSGALAAAAAVLAIYAWQRNRAAWIGFFVLAGLMALTLPVAGVLPVLMLAAGATFLASRPVRDWFADRAPATSGPPVAWAQQQGPPEGDGGAGPGPQPPPYPGRFGAGGGSTAAPSGEEGGSPEQPGTTGRPDGPPSYGPWHGGSDPAQPQPQPHPQPYAQPQAQPQEPGPAYAPGYGAPPHVPAYGEWQGQSQGPGRDPDKRPATVTAACVITWVGCALVVLVTGIVALVLSADRGAFVREFQRQADIADVQVTADEVLAIAWTIAALALLWCLVAVTLAVLAFRRSRGGRIGLAVSAALTVVVSLLLVLSVIAVVPLLLGIAVLVLLFTGGANDWYARRTGWHGPPAGGGPYGPPVEQPPSYGQQGPYGQQPPPPGRSGPW